VPVAGANTVFRIFDHEIDPDSIVLNSDPEGSNHHFIASAVGGLYVLTNQGPAYIGMKNWKEYLDEAMQDQ